MNLESSSAPPAGEPNETTNASEANSETPPESGSRGLRGSGLRFREDDANVPSWARGKTADELLQITNQLYDALQRGDTAPAPTNPAPSAPSPSHETTPNVSGIPEVDPNLIYSNPAEYHRQMEARTNALIESRLASAERTVSTPLASLAKAEAMRNPKRKLVWEKYAPEIETVMARVPESQRGRVDLWDEAAKIVAGEHFEELARAKAEELMRSGASGSLATQAGSATLPNASSSRSPIAKLFDENHPAIEGFKRDGISPSQVEAHAKARGHDLEAYANLLKSRASRKKGVPA